MRFRVRNLKECKLSLYRNELSFLVKELLWFNYHDMFSNPLLMRVCMTDRLDEVDVSHYSNHEKHVGDDEVNESALDGLLAQRQGHNACHRREDACDGLARHETGHTYRVEQTSQTRCRTLPHCHAHCRTTRVFKTCLIV